MKPMFRPLLRLNPATWKIKEGYKYLIVAGVALVLGALLFRGGSSQQHSAASSHTEEHAEVVHDGHGAESEAATYTCSMHPQIRSKEPGKCPICGMDLIPVQGEGGPQGPPERVTLSERARALAKVHTVPVRRSGDPSAELRLLGRVEADETKSRTVTAWLGGRIERLHVKVTGEKVKSGQSIATLYSPEVFAAHQDLIAARRQQERMEGASATARAAATAALSAARDRLRLLGISDARVKAMEAESQPSRQITISTPFAGTVVERVASEGAYVSTGEPLYRLADLSGVWVQLDAYERDLPSLRLEQSVEITVDALPERTFEGKVAFIDPTLDAQRRTARVRVEVENKEGLLRPGAFAQAIVRGNASEKGESPLVIPHTSPLFTGRRSIVYVEVPDAQEPTYEARVVRLGPRAGNDYPVVTGLREGERVVTKGAFALDADLQIRGGASMMTGLDDSDEGSWEVIELQPSEKAELKAYILAYLALQEALAADDLHPAHSAAKDLEKALGSIAFSHTKRAREFFLTLEPDLRKHIAAILQAKDLGEVRGPFEELSRQMTRLLRSFGNVTGIELGVASCPMAFGRGATWVQKSGDLRNPYFGKSMLDCGQIDHSLGPQSHLQDAPVIARETRAPAPGHQH
jgi:membrane fusion protein, copper/silver efflux system